MIYPSYSRCWALLLFLGLTAGACTPDFEEEWQVLDLRILGIRTYPPEVHVSPGSQTFPPVSIHPLVVDPRQERSNEPYRWEIWLCTAEEDSCEEAPEDERELLVERTTPLSQITHRFTLTRNRYEQALDRDRFSGLGGVPIMIELRIQDANSNDPNAPLIVRGVKRIPYGEKDKVVGAENKHPRLGLTIDGKPLDQVNNLRASDVVRLLPDGLASEEIYNRPTLSGGFDPVVPSEDLEEALAFFFFVTDGELSRGRTGGEDSPFFDLDSTDDLSSEWTIPDAPGADVTLWIVVREERGGVAWLTKTFPVTE